MRGVTRPVALPAPSQVFDAPVPDTVCLSCGVPLTGPYCAACGQPAIDLAAPTRQVVWEAVADVTDLDGRVLRTLRGLCSPGWLTAEFLRGRRAPYLGPLKVFVLAGTMLTTTWVITRGVDTHYYGLPPAGSAAGAYIDMVVRGSLAACLVIALTNWVIAGGRRRLLDEVVFALHVVAALSLVTSGVIWLATAWKLLWGTVASTPRGLPSLPYLLFLPAGLLSLAYIGGALRRVYGGAWWVTVLRAAALIGVGLATEMLIVVARRPT